MNSPWPEWLACLLAAICVLIARKRGFAWAAAGGLVVVIVCWIGSAGVFLLPPFAAVILMLFQKPSGGAGTTVLALLLVATGALACWLFPEPSRPPLPGVYKVGTRTLEIPADGGSPRLCFQAWYPAESAGKERASWLPDPGLAPAFPFHRIGKAASRSWSQVPMLQGDRPFPILFYEHAWNGHRAENVAQAEDLASRGFVVIAIDHPGQAALIHHADGSEIRGRFPSVPDLSSDKAVLAFKADAEHLIAERARDVKRVRQALLGDLLPEWKGRLRADHGGVFGFSFGGTTAIRLCANDPWFRAGANEDGFLLDSVFPKGPFLYFDDEIPAWLKQPPATDETAEQRLIRRSDELTADAAKAPGCKRIPLDGTRHESFTDRIFLCPIPRLAKAGRRPAVETHHAIASALAGFFIRELKPDQEAAVTR